jgi:hypothetical protein
MSADHFGDPRFPRARCDICGFLCIMEQVAQYALVRLADGQSKVITACNTCGNAPAENFRLEKLG